MRILTAPPGSETIGLMFGTFVDNLQSAETRPVMVKHNLVGLDPMGWYPAQRLLDALNELSSNSNQSANLVAIGMRIGETVPLPPEMLDPQIEDVLAIWNDLYQMLHRGGDLGCIRYEKVADKHCKTIHTVPYPDDMSYGVLYGYGKRFLSASTHFRVFYDPDFPARDYGGTGESTIIHIKWE